MIYDKIQKGRFLARPNRFIANVDLDGTIWQAHVKNTGRLKELLLPGATVYLEDFRHKMGVRKMSFSLIGVEKQMHGISIPINVDSQAPNKVVFEALSAGRLPLPGLITEDSLFIKPETTYASSRFDFYLRDKKGREAFMEVKGVTLEEGGVARFPDAPTQRGIKHIEELIAAKGQGYLAYVLFVIQLKGIASFEPNDKTHQEFGDTLRRAAKAGVHALAFDCLVTKDSLKLDAPVPVSL